MTQQPSSDSTQEESTPFLLEEQKDQPQSLWQDNEENLKARERVFLQHLRQEIEKVSLFSLKKQGELADAIGALRFPLTSMGQPQTLFAGRNLLTGNIVENGTNAEIDAYTALGVELIHLIRFICINSSGVRKILKKYNKTVLQNTSRDEHAARSSSHRRLLSTGGIMDSTTAIPATAPPMTPTTPVNRKKLTTHTEETDRNELFSQEKDVHLQNFANSASIAAIHASLTSAAVAFSTDVQNHGADSATSTSLLRLNFVLASIDTLREAAKVVNHSYTNFLSRRAMIATGVHMESLESSADHALRTLLQFDPDSILHMSPEELHAWSSTLFRGGEDAQPFVTDAPSRRRKHSRMMSSTKLLIEDLEEDEQEEEYADRVWGGVDSHSLAINFASALMYTVNYYCVAPNANRYAILLGHDGAYGATLIGASSFTAIFAAFTYSWWYTKLSFKSALIFSSICPMIGNLLYSLALSYRSMSMAIMGRFLCGFGSAEVVNRQLISACVSFERMARASALFVASSAAGMSIGPLMGSVFDMISGRDVAVDIELPFLPSGGIIYNHVTGPGFFMALLWAIQLVVLVFLFQEPKRVNVSGSRHKVFDADPITISFDAFSDTSTYGTHPLLRDSVKKSDRKSVSSHVMSAGKSIVNEVRTSVGLIFENPGLPVTLLLFCYIELADEVLISSCAMVCKRYFGWHGSTAGLIIASLGALVLPADYVVERASHVFSERAIMKGSVIFIIVSLIAILNFEALWYDILGLGVEFVDSVYNNDTTVDEVDIEIGGKKVGELLNSKKEFPYDWGAGDAVYIIFLSAIFCGACTAFFTFFEVEIYILDSSTRLLFTTCAGTIILEGVDTSLMAKVTPAKLNSAFINSGLLATLVGTLGRVFADMIITFSALAGTCARHEDCSTLFLRIASHLITTHYFETPTDVYVFVDFVVATFSPLLLLAVLGYFLVRWNYSDLLVG
eukprot:scaffold286_cov169-Amphora_coffeaeformis.AAC.16